MPDNTEPNGGQDPGPTGSTPVTDVADNDPGPIEFDIVMKSFLPPPADPMADRDLHLRDISEHDDDGR